MSQIHLTDDAKLDIKESTSYYENKLDGLGYDFLDEIEKVLDRIKQNPEQFPIVYKEVRKALTEKFPFIILFLVNGMQIIVFAVFHTSRAPEKWKNRSE